ncbi:DUF2971 domain-containing protein [Flavobacteriaceae bacterium XHP0103]|uniref:DUF2971 domain-containing protein n=1 Tax=Marixanthotalea marina TaxID=2844359 RepID=UPI002989B6A5|nr:DUF2971 domain-containing protein [Marixanthotalea marina]MBU3821313.1 DUF2971 domain-containing protein [Marixanthotalea marina]
MLLYKYRSGNKEVFKRDLFALEHNYFWGSSIEKLNDPCEGLVTSDGFLKQSNSLELFFGKKVKDDFINLKTALEDVIAVNKKIGVYSLSKNYTDELLWAHYGDSHQGYCIEYDLQNLELGYRNKIYSFPVKYSNKPPDIDFRDINSSNTKIIEKIIGFKSKRWEYEQEYRIISDFSGEFFYHPNSIKSIYFGIRMEDSKKEEMINTLKGRGIKFYQMCQLEKSYKFYGELLPQYNKEESTFMKEFNFSNHKIEFDLLDTKYSIFINRGDIVIRLKKIISKNEIEKLSNYLFKYLFLKAVTLLIQIYQENQREDDICWATSFYRNEVWEININDFVI